MKSRCGDALYWHNCYKGTYDLIAPESMAHPAKMAPTVGFRVLEHLEELGLLSAGDTILDPMAGTGLTNICAGAKGYRSISVELEASFIGYQNQNKTYAERRLFKLLDWQIIEGDSRELSVLLSEKGLVSLTSPPYGQAQTGQGIAVEGYRGKKHMPTDLVGQRSYMPQVHGMTEGQIANLPDRPLKAITSPPYGEAVNAGKGGIDWEKAGRPDRLPENEPAPSVQGTREWRYSEDDGNIGNLPDRPEGASYLSAMLKVYQEIAAVSDILAVVIKNPTRNKQLRRLDLDTIKLLELAGWIIHCQHRALLFEELELATLFGETTRRVKGRMSFFKRLSWQNGQPVAAWEDIIIAKKGEG